MSKKRITSIKRRDFLKAAGFGGVAGAAAAVTGLSTAEAATLDEGARDGAYRETAHVRKYYELARF